MGQGDEVVKGQGDEVVKGQGDEVVKGQGDEQFMRIVGKRRTPPAGEPPSPEARQAMAAMANYLTRAPKGVFVYRNHEEANRDRDRWLVQAMAEKRRHG